MNPAAEIIRNMRIICLLQIFFCFSILGLFTIADQHLQLNYKALETLIPWLSVTVLIIAAIDHFQFLRRIQRSANLPFEERLKAYRRATIFRFTVIETISILFGILFLFTGSLIYLLESALGAFLMLYFYPSILKIAKDLSVSVQELEQSIS